MEQALFWIYTVNLLFLIVHEMDSAYWKEWELFRLPGGLGGFLLIHFPLLLPALWGIVQVKELTRAGLIISLVVAGAGLFAFSIHTYFIKKGREEFTPLVSRVILFGTLFLSILQAVLTVMLMT
ncbi:MAG: hypothetical protein JW885_08355 [Deltaproteobacteria bacterium]|nr:hypothetical protein [Candidatus Zymogenaceae bacterium]